MRMLRNLARRKLRTTLTILGITIGIWALVVFSSMANKINALIEGGSRYYEDKIVVSDASNFAVGFAIAPMRATVADEIAALDGVAVAVPQVQLLFESGPIGNSFGYPDVLVGSGEIPEGLEDFPLRPARGRNLMPDDAERFVVVLGADLAQRLAAAPDDTIEIRASEFEVVGVLEPTLTAPDTTAYMPLTAAQELFVDDLPPVIREDVEADELATQIVVYPAEGIDVAALAEEIEARVENVTSLTGEEFDQQIGSSVAIFNAIIIGVAAISLVVGGLSVINTMAMSVAERTREIGIKRAIGGSRGRIIRELIAEAALIGLIGGLIGLGLGAVVVLLANEAGRASGTILFDLTPGTAIFAVAFSTILGMLAGLVPAWGAARMDPVAALRYE